MSEKYPTVYIDNFATERCAETRWFYTYDNRNVDGEELKVEVTRCNMAKDLAEFLKEKFNKVPLRHVPSTWWSVKTYITKPDGTCYGAYNPQLTQDKRRINPEWILAGTPGNLRLIMQEIVFQFHMC